MKRAVNMRGTTKKKKKYFLLLLFLCLVIAGCINKTEGDILRINEKGYFVKPGLNVMVFDDYYPEGHQGGIGIIQNGVRVATNGDLRLEPTPGQWQPVPQMMQKITDTINGIISVDLKYPDPEREKGFNPISYPDLEMNYTVNVAAEGHAFKIAVDLDEEIPMEWLGKVGFNLELFPPEFFGKSYYMDNDFGIFPRQANGPMKISNDDHFHPVPLAVGKKLTIIPENETSTITIETANSELQLFDGRIQHNNGWFIVRTNIPQEKTKNAIEWHVTVNTVPGWKYKPVVKVSQVGYHPDQKKTAIIELDESENDLSKAKLYKITANGITRVFEKKPGIWGKFLRYQYAQFDFSDIQDPGMYRVSYNGIRSHPFQISDSVYTDHVWQPTLEYFLPVQMCHMEVREKYRVWHGKCHLDDALMAPPELNHFDGYNQGKSTLTDYAPFQHVPGLNTGGWHDAGDYDIRIESQANTVLMLVRAYEEFHVDYDQTLVNQEEKIVEIHHPDGIPDIVQQIEHGILNILGGYKSLGRLYDGIICPRLRQYVLLGDGSTMTDNIVYKSTSKTGAVEDIYSGERDDRLVFTEQHASHEFKGIASLAAASRVLGEYDRQLSRDCLNAAIRLWNQEREIKNSYVLTRQVEAAIELFISTGEDKYKDILRDNITEITSNIKQAGWLMGYARKYTGDDILNDDLINALRDLKGEVDESSRQNPFGLTYDPNIWGDGWNIQREGVKQYYLHAGFPDIFNNEIMLNALNFILGCHPGPNTASFASGVGSNSVLVAYGVNRADWSYIPGGVVSGTALIRPDFPELKEWPYLWQQTEYVMGGGATNFMFLVLAADHLLNLKK